MWCDNNCQKKNETEKNETVVAAMGRRVMSPGEFRVCQVIVSLSTMGLMILSHLSRATLVHWELGAMFFSFLLTAMQLVCTLGYFENRSDFTSGDTVTLLIVWISCLPAGLYANVKCDRSALWKVCGEIAKKHALDATTLYRFCRRHCVNRFEILTKAEAPDFNERFCQLLGQDLLVEESKASFATLLQEKPVVKKEKVKKIKK
jgi:hypothetical protein